MKLYNELAEYYFKIESNHRDIRNDISLIRSYVKADDRKSVLDLGCGTGEHLEALRRFGYTVTGIDMSDEMLKIAKKRYPSGIRFINKNFSDFDFYNEFDSVICLFGSMDYLLHDKDVDTLFWNSWRALKTGGFGIFEVWHSIPVRKIKNKPLAHISRTKVGDTLIERERGFDLIEDPKRTIVKVNYVYKIHSTEESKTCNDVHIMRAFTLEEITSFIKSNGFSIINVFANSGRDIFNENSNKMVLIIEKAP